MAGIFRAYDIRGIVGDKPGQLSSRVMRHIGFAYSQFMLEHHLLSPGDEIPVGADVRTHSPMLKTAFIEGARAAGLVVLDIGTVSTPHAYFAVAHYPYKGGAIITASHNQKEYNGVKIMKKNAECLSADDGIYDIEARVAKLEALANAGKHPLPPLPKNARPVKAKDVTKDYEDWVSAKVKLAKTLNVIIDCGNGSTSGHFTRLLKRIGCTVTELYCTPDGTFPNHEPDPTEDEYIVEIQKRIKTANNAGKPFDLGIALDGDGDRVVFLTEKGEILRGDESFAILAGLEIEKAKEKNAKAKPVFITEVVATRGPIRYIEALGGKVSMVRVGHSFIFGEIVRQHATLAGEYSGHLFYPENYGVDDAMFGAIKMCEVVSHGTPLSVLYGRIPRLISTPKMKIKLPENEKTRVANAVRDAIVKEYGKKALTLDGVRLELPHAWGLLRPSNTGPELVLRFEGDTQKDLEGVQRVFRKALEGTGYAF